MQGFFWQLAKDLVLQLGWLFGLLFGFGFVLSKLQEWTQINYERSVGWKGILWTAWFGTPFHEYSHAFFAKLFRHKITEIALFRPNKETGELGYVNHSWNQKSFYQSVGNFFIGLAPLILGSTFLVIFLYILVPNGQEIFKPLGEVNSWGTVLPAIKKSLLLLFSINNIKNGWFWLFLYLSFCLASHLAPSKADRRGMWKGFALIVIVLIVINLLALLIKIDLTPYIITFSNWLSVFTGVFLYATLISFLHWLVSGLLLWPFRR